ALSMFSAVRRLSPLRSLRTSRSLSDRVSNIGHLKTQMSKIQAHLRPVNAQGTGVRDQGSGKKKTRAFPGPRSLAPAPYKAAKACSAAESVRSRRSSVWAEPTNAHSYC